MGFGGFHHWWYMDKFPGVWDFVVLPGVVEYVGKYLDCYWAKCFMCKFDTLVGPVAEEFSRFMIKM